MRNIEQMKGKMFDLVDQVRELAKEDRDLSAEEVEKRDKMLADIKFMEADIAAEEQLQRVEAQKAKVVSDPEKEKAEWRSLGEFVQTIAKNPNDKRLAGRETDLPAEERQQIQGVGADGGFLVPEIFSKELLTVSPDEAIIRPRARVFGAQTSGTAAAGFGDFHIPALDYVAGANMYAGATVQWIDEAAAKPATQIVFNRITLSPYEVAAHVPISDRLLYNAPAIEQIVKTQLRGALIDAEENTFLNDTAAGTPTGIIDHAATITVARPAPGGVVYQDLADMLAVFWGKRGVWITGRDMLPQLMALQDPNNNYIWQPNARDGNPGTIFGMPVLFSDHSPAMGDLGDVVLADLSYYLIADGMGISMAVSPHQRFTENITLIKAWKTVDGSPWLTGPLPTSTPTSPFVELAA